MYGVTLTGFEKQLERILRRHPHLQDLANDFVVGKRTLGVDAGTAMVEVMTAHKAKGKEAETVILLEAVLRQFPKVHADNQLFSPFGVTAEEVLAEERRLFYVAVTRAKHRLMVLTEKDKESPYLVAINRRRLAGDRLHNTSAHLCAEAKMIRAHLARIDDELLIRQNISPQALSAWDRLVESSMGLPGQLFNFDGYGSWHGLSTGPQ